MGSTEDTTSNIRSDRLRGVPQQLGAPAGAQAYEMGSITGLSRTGRYKAFASPFTARPFVVVTPFRLPASGTVHAMFTGTPNTGSFQCRVLTAPAGGSVTAFYLAMGAR